MAGYIEVTDRGQVTLFPDRLQDWIGEDIRVRFFEVFVNEIELAELGYGRRVRCRSMKGFEY